MTSTSPAFSSKFKTWVRTGAFLRTEGEAAIIPGFRNLRIQYFGRSSERPKDRRLLREVLQRLEEMDREPSLEVVEGLDDPLEDALVYPGLKDPVAELPDHSDLCTLEFRYNSVRIQKTFPKFFRNSEIHKFRNSETSQHILECSMFGEIPKKI